MRSSSDRIHTSETLTGRDGERRALESAARRAVRALCPVALLALALLAALMLVPALAGLDRYVITGGSMQGAYDRGSIVYEQAVPLSELRVGDVITFEPPGVTGADGTVTHRIVQITDHPDRRGVLLFRTKGDANPHPDPWQVRLEGPNQARAVFSIPYLGYGFAALGERWLRITVIGLPALLIAISMLARLWREAGEEARRRRSSPAPAETGA
jgi:signal peptidase I